MPTVNSYSDEEAARIWENARANKNHSYHYVAFAIPGLTYAAEYARAIVSDYKSQFYAINEAGESGLLGNATFIPVEKANYYLSVVEHKPLPYSEDERVAHYRDVLEAQELYVKAQTIVVDLRDFYNLALELCYQFSIIPILEESRYAEQIEVLI